MDERGFTLIELIVAVLVIGILAAIALPSFIGQADKARDVAAKADVRNAVSQMEACFRSNEMYTGCPDNDHLLAAGVIPTLTGGGSAYSVSTFSGSGTEFTIERLSAGYSYSCTTPGSGGCRADGSW